MRRIPKVKDIYSEIIRSEIVNGHRIREQNDDSELVEYIRRAPASEAVVEALVALAEGIENGSVVPL